MSSNGRIKLCIVGGGPLGIGLGRELNEGGIDYDLYETEADFGGVWNREGKSGRVYPSLHLISPKFNTQVPDFPTAVTIRIDVTISGSASTASMKRLATSSTTPRR